MAWGQQPELETALEAARRIAPELARTSRGERAEWCKAVAKALLLEQETFAQLILSECGKPIRYARAEVLRAATTFELAATEALRFDGELVPLDGTPQGRGYLGFTRRVPLGPVAAITPFNFPLNLVAHKLAPAMAVGAPFMLKPAPNTPVTALRLCQLILQAGFPKQAVSCLNLEVDLTQKLVSDPRIAFVSFTGSASVGWRLKTLASHKAVALELGGNAAVIVHSDADLERAIPKIVAGGYAYAGQVCISVQRIYVHRPVYEKFKSAYLQAVRDIVVGDPGHPDTMVGPLIRAQEGQRLSQLIEGYPLLCGGQSHPPVFQPTVVENVPQDAPLARQEIFGPITLLWPYDTFEEALTLADNSDYGLQVGIFTRDITRAFVSHETMNVGAVIINDVPTFRVDNMPYGGTKQSGFGREGVAYTMQEMTQPRLLVINGNI